MQFKTWYKLPGEIGGCGWELGGSSQRKKERPLSSRVVGGRQARVDVYAGKCAPKATLAFSLRRMRFSAENDSQDSAGVCVCGIAAVRKQADCQLLGCLLTSSAEDGDQDLYWYQPSGFDATFQHLRRQTQGKLGRDLSNLEEKGPRT